MKGCSPILISVVIVGFLLGIASCLALAETSMSSYPYEMPSDKRSEFIGLLRKFKAGDTYEQVRDVLGPAFEESSIRGKKYDSSIRGKEVTYFLKKFHRMGVNEKKDEYVDLVFDNDKKLVCAYTNIRDLTLSVELPTWYVLFQGDGYKVIPPAGQK